MLEILILLFVLTILYSIFIHYKYWKKKGVRQGFVIPLIGDIFYTLIKGHPVYITLQILYNKFSDVRYCGLYQYTSPVLLIRDPQLIHQIGIKHSDHFVDRRMLSVEEENPLWNRNLNHLKGQEWKDMRAILSPTFTGSKLRKMFVLLNLCATNMVDFLKKNPEEFVEIELKDMFTRYGSDITASVFFGIQSDSLTDPEDEFFMKGKKITQFSGKRYLKYMASITNALLAKVVNYSIYDEEVSAYFMKIIKDLIEYREKNNIDRPDMISLLIQGKRRNKTEGEFAELKETELSDHHENINLSLEDITSHALLFYLAGIDTIPTILSFMAYELAINPDIQRKLFEELNEHRLQNDNVSYDELSKFSYLDMVTSETLRKWPPTHITDRICTKPYTIEPKYSDEIPVKLEIGDIVWLPIWPIHRDHKYWENPEKFDPERFSLENKKKITPYSYIPFGVGPRNCIAFRFAIMEIKIAFYHIITNFEIVPTNRSSIPFKSKKRINSLTSHTGFWFGFKKRNGIQ
ncbi:hypothetical protein HHI36_015319 [Cryptolaemus montrouzieri]|uniref:Cytochrome P450 n=1 Tax=Cryptolaemus montrouzieri TaxID=559131 RepID=A0ABD2N5D0_9CUCU